MPKNGGCNNNGSAVIVSIIIIIIIILIVCMICYAFASTNNTNNCDNFTNATLPISAKHIIRGPIPGTTLKGLNSMCSTQVPCMIQEALSTIDGNYILGDMPGCINKNKCEIRTSINNNIPTFINNTNLPKGFLGTSINLNNNDSVSLAGSCTYGHCLLMAKVGPYSTTGMWVAGCYNSGLTQCNPFIVDHDVVTHGPINVGANGGHMVNYKTPVKKSK